MKSARRLSAVVSLLVLASAASALDLRLRRDAVTCLDSDTGERHPEGPVSTGDPCKDCHCLPSGDIACGERGCLTQTCPNNIAPVTKDGECCPTCPEPACVDENGQKFYEGRMGTSDPCQVCNCLASGEIECTVPGCVTQCDNPVQIEGQCCPACPNGCSHEGKWYEPGPIPDDDPCRDWYCEATTGRLFYGRKC